ncbi:hypothetical protein NEFER03_1151 [Nematocida sp. LUAm3]|nr:hypothetical protein NEFER03_1151 [Nematocida sp. LUAm3]KAI5176313.1 hypothetical protein NEFER02_2101 [Nematocida sp. LUAm2]KAI5178256.1 hypothetical protein NEFER01_1423 [Nematocida sp. LUAm1]
MDKNKTITILTITAISLGVVCMSSYVFIPLIFLKKGTASIKNNKTNPKPTSNRIHPLPLQNLSTLSQENIQTLSSQQPIVVNEEESLNASSLSTESSKLESNQPPQEYITSQPKEPANDDAAAAKKPPVKNPNASNIEFDDGRNSNNEEAHTPNLSKENSSTTRRYRSIFENPYVPNIELDDEDTATTGEGTTTANPKKSKQMFFGPTSQFHIDF